MDDEHGHEPEFLAVPAPGRATLGAWVRLRISVLRRDRTLRRTVVLPGVVAIIVLALALLFAPSINSDNHGEFSDAFGTSAQVIATLFVALAVEARSLSMADATARRLVTGWTLTLLGLGVVAAVVALNPALTACAYRLLFGVTMGSGIGALLSVIAIAYEIFDADVGEAAGGAGRDLTKGRE